MVESFKVRRTSQPTEVWEFKKHQEDNAGAHEDMGMETAEHSYKDAGLQMLAH